MSRIDSARHRAIEVSSVHAPAGRRNGPPPTMSSIGRERARSPGTRASCRRRRRRQPDQRADGPVAGRVQVITTRRFGHGRGPYLRDAGARGRAGHPNSRRQDRHRRRAVVRRCHRVGVASLRIFGNAPRRSRRPGGITRSTCFLESVLPSPAGRSPRPEEARCPLRPIPIARRSPKVSHATPWPRSGDVMSDVREWVDGERIVRVAGLDGAAARSGRRAPRSTPWCRPACGPPARRWPTGAAHMRSGSRRRRQGCSVGWWAWSSRCCRRSASRGRGRARPDGRPPRTRTRGGRWWRSRRRRARPRPILTGSTSSGCGARAPASDSRAWSGG